MPDKITLFMDPEKVIREKKSCKLHPTKSKIENTKLSTVWKFLTKDDASVEERRWHDSLVDVRAQTDIILDPRFVPWIDREVSIRTVDKIFADAVTREWKKTMEPLRPVHDPWIEQTEDSQIEWEPDEADCYTGPDGGPPSGPSAKMKEVARTAKNLAPLFLAILPWKFWKHCSKKSEIYAYKDWVVEEGCEDGKRPRLKQCHKNTTNSRHRANKEAKSSLFLLLTFSFSFQF